MDNQAILLLAPNQSGVSDFMKLQLCLSKEKTGDECDRIESLGFCRNQQFAARDIFAAARMTNKANTLDRIHRSKSVDTLGQNAW